MPAENVIPYDSPINTDNELSDSDNDNDHEKYMVQKCPIYKEAIKIFKPIEELDMNTTCISPISVASSSVESNYIEAKEIILSIPRAVNTCKYQAIIKNGVIEFGYV